MNETQVWNIALNSSLSRPDVAPTVGSLWPATDFMRPDEVTNDSWLTQAEKREILASWASDIRAVPDAPALRQLDNGAVVRIDDVLRALKSLNEAKVPAQMPSDPSHAFARLRARLRSRMRLPLRHGRSDDDDDPPPCPAMIAGPRIGPLPGGETADPGLALAA